MERKDKFIQVLQGVFLLLSITVLTTNLINQRKKTCKCKEKKG